MNQTFKKIYLSLGGLDYKGLFYTFKILTKFSIKSTPPQAEGLQLRFGKTVSDIKYDHPGSQNNNPFYPFNDQLNYALANYFTKSKTTKSSVDRFLSNPLMASLTEKLSYQNADKWMEKLLDIPGDIRNHKWSDYKLQLQSGVGVMAGREISIHLQNAIGCLEFLIGHPGFWHNQTHESSCVYNENEHQVYNEMHTGEWWWKQ